MRYTTKDRKIIATKPVCNTITTVIYDIEYGVNDRVLVGDAILDNGYTVPHWAAIRYNNNGDSYFIHYGCREKLSDYIRTNY